MIGFFKSFRIIFLLLFVDLITKYLFFDIELAQNIFHATFNTGISFGIGIPQTVIQIITTLFLILIIYLLQQRQIHPIIAALIIAGGLGNLLDRIFLGGVRDFIRLGFGPVFNVADIYINLAVVYYILFEIKS